MVEMYGQRVTRILQDIPCSRLCVGSAGVLRACHKRPISVNQINQLVDEVETEIFNMEEKEIPSRVKKHISV